MTPRLQAQPRQGRKKLRWIAAAGFVFLAVLVNEVAGKSGYVARQEQLQRIEELSNDIGRLRQRNQELARRIHDLRNSPEAIEAIAREQLHLGRPGEVVVTLQAPGLSEPVNPPLATLR
jgi:cell division protein FtsB